uniref:RNA ligase/cyclic nucleotide phosphodiesterase family protein n=1 Tax=Kalanchoe fedtschenkoi TaxID=63787 RepID=A0A7N0RE54_KALFE
MVPRNRSTCFDPRTHPFRLFIRSLAFLGFISFSLFIFSTSTEPGAMLEQKAQDAASYVYSVWGIPSEEVRPRLKKLMRELRTEFNGPEFEPHVTVVGAIALREEDAVEKFRAACAGLKAYEASVVKVDRGTFFYQCVYLLLQPTAEVVETSAHCTGHFGYKSSTPYMPHLSLLYADISDEEKKKAQEKAKALDPTIEELKFQITHLALYKTDTEDKSLKSWEKVTECSLTPP